jgi:hypothetical protein
MNVKHVEIILNVEDVKKMAFGGDFSARMVSSCI